MPFTSRSQLILILTLSLSSSLISQQRPLASLDRDRALGILQIVTNDIKKHYYDPKMHNVDWDAKLAQTKEAISKATSFNMALAHIAAMIDSLDDSHTFFVPPQHAYRLDYAFKYEMVGDRCFVTEVRPKSDAETKGVKRGDELLTLNGFDEAGTPSGKCNMPLPFFDRSRRCSSICAIPWAHLALPWLRPKSARRNLSKT